MRVYDWRRIAGLCAYRCLVARGRDVSLYRSCDGIAVLQELARYLSAWVWTMSKGVLNALSTHYRVEILGLLVWTYVSRCFIGMGSDTQICTDGGLFHTIRLEAVVFCINAGVAEAGLFERDEKSCVAA
jgi:hypothetical protein